MRMSYLVIVLIYDIKRVQLQCYDSVQSHFSSTAGGTRRVLCWFHAIVEGRSFCVAHY